MENSPPKIVGEICHIHSDKKTGPRALVGLTTEEYNAYENLIMLCPTHHRIVDGQPASYPAETLKEWKEMHEAKSYIVSSENLYAPPEVFYHLHFPTALVDQSIEEEVNLLRKSRFFSEFNGTGRALALSRRLSEGDFYGGTATVKASALAWCARILAGGGKLDEAEENLALAEKMGNESKIARAFIWMQKGDRNRALSVLAGIDSPSARSAILTITGLHDGPMEAVDRLTASGLGVSDLDPDGKFILMKFQLELGEWKAARETVEAVNENDFVEAPVLHHMVAVAYLLSTVPLDYRIVVLRQVPLNALIFPLASDATSIEIRRKARTHFISAKQVAQGFGCHGVAAELDSYALWLELRDPEFSENGRLKLEDRIRNLETALHLVPLCLQYGIPLDKAAVEQEIDKQAFHSDLSQDAAFARLAMARMQENPEDIATYFDRHFNTFSTHLDVRAVQSIQIEILAMAGLTNRAEECLDLLLEDGLSDADECRYRLMIARGEGKDTCEGQLELFKKTGSQSDLEVLVAELERKEDWDELCEYAEILFEKTCFIHDAERLAIALHNSNKFSRIIELHQAQADIMEQSTNLKVLYCWALFFEGDLLRARCELNKLETDWEDTTYRNLQISMSVTLGDLDSLSACIASAYRQTEDKSARELVKAAEFSLYLKLDSAKELLFAAAEKGNDDADVLSHAYFLVTRAGWEADPETASWLQRAVDLSGEDGPLWPVTINDILDLKPEWDRHELRTRQLLDRGESPMFFAAQFLSRSLMNLTLFPAMTNSAQRDLRRKFGIPGFSGQRGPTHSIASGTIGLDYTALLTLSFLNLLEKVFDTFDTIYVPHSALAWLFEERQNASFHQPSRIRDARRILYFLSTGALKELTPVTGGDRELSTYVGDDLATFIAEAESAKPGDTQRLVIRPSPVNIAGSLGDEVADLTSHSSVLVSCQAVVEKLSEMAEIEDFEERKALAYLQLQEKTWSHQLEITDNATLYLDNLAVHYLLHAGILEKLCMLDFELYVSSSLVAELNGLIAYESISGKIIDEIETMRSVVKQGIECRKVKVGKWRNFGNGDEQSPDFFHIAGLFAMAEDCDAIVVDDRFFNQHQYIDFNVEQTPLFSTIDVLDSLVSAGSISPKQRLALRTRLRRAGYFFVPLTEDEVNRHLNAAEVKDGKLIERTHLRAIRESILHVRMNDWLQLPIEGGWPETVFDILVNALRNLWKEGADIPRVEVLSDWLWDQLDVRGWAHLIGPEIRDETIRSGRTRIILLLLTSLDVDIPRDIREAYWAWLEDRVLAPAKELEPDLFTLIIDLKRRQISEVADAVLTEMEQRDE